MRLIVFSTPVTILVDILAWFVIHMVVSWAMTNVRHTLFNPGDFLFRARAWEGNGAFYEAVCRVRHWKGWLPDAAAWFTGGFPKRSLGSMESAYLDRFIRETCRGEAAHWLVLAASPLFSLWNPAWVGCVMIIYGVFANLPCIITQRYNRLRLLRIGGSAKKRRE